MQRATSKETVLHHALGKQKDKACQSNDEEKLQNSGQPHSLFVRVHRTPGSSHSNRLSGLGLQAAVSVRAALFRAPKGSKNKVVEQGCRFRAPRRGNLSIVCACQENAIQM
jgi:hypothetical protein